MTTEPDMALILVKLGLLRQHTRDTYIGAVPIPQCRRESQGFVCTRAPGHHGLCIAHAGNDMVCSVFDETKVYV